MSDVSDIAIVGMAGRFPQSNSIAEFWRALCLGKDCISRFGEDEQEANFALRDHPQFVRAWGIINGEDRFDPSYFRMSAREASQRDPQQRLFLQACVHALEDAGINPKKSEEVISLYAGQTISNYHSRVAAEAKTPGEAFSALYSNHADYLTTFVSYKLDLKGESMGVQTACSTSLVAVVLAVQSLLRGQCDVALAGGVSLILPQRGGYLYQEGMIFSPDGVCRAFDARANGTSFGSGCGVVVLKRMEDALMAHDRIYAVIKGAAMNNDGADKVGFTAPSSSGQTEVISLAQALADVDPETITYVETHGTGTRLGDPIEVDALTRAFRRGTQAKGFCAIGSLKTNFGHMSEAAGVANLMKAALATKTRFIPASLNYETQNPAIDFADSPFFVAARAQPWQPACGVRRAGVSSFGIGGTNAHVVIEEPPATSATTSTAARVTVTAKTKASLQAHKMALAEALLAKTQEPAPIDTNTTVADVAHTLARRPQHAEVEHFDVDSVEALAQALRQGKASNAATKPSPPASNGRTVTLPGYAFARERHRIVRYPTSATPAFVATGQVDPRERAQLLFVGSDSEAGLVHRCTVAAQQLRHVADSDLSGALSMLTPSSKLPFRLVGVVHSVEDARRLLRDPTQVRHASRAPKTLFVFSGQGTQWTRMARGLLDHPAVQDVAATFDVAHREAAGFSILDAMTEDGEHARMHRTEVAQPAIVLTGILLARVLQARGFLPDAVMGHSVGEIAAGCVAGAFSVATAAQLVATRARHMATLQGSGLTAAIEADAAVLDQLLPSSVAIAGYNSPEQTIIAGDADAVKDVVAQAKKRGWRAKILEVDIPFHSPVVDRVLDGYARDIQALTMQAPTVGWYRTCVPDAAVALNAVPTIEGWKANVRAPVFFQQSILRAKTDGIEHVVEVAAHSVLAQAVAVTSHLPVTLTLRRSMPDAWSLLHAEAELIAAGHDPVARDVAEADTGEGPQSLSLETIGTIVAATLREPGRRMDVDATFDALGLDSVALLTLIDRIKRLTGVHLSTADVLRARTPRALVMQATAPSHQPAVLAPIVRCSAKTARALYLFPGAAGTALMMRPYALLDDVDTFAFEPSAHDATRRGDVVACARVYADAIEANGATPVLLGFSFGGLGAFATACELRRRGVDVLGLVISHTLPPDVWPREQHSGTERLGAVFTALHRSLGLEGVPLAEFIQSARTDFAAAEGFAVHAAPLDQTVPTTLLSSATDEHAPAVDMQGWRLVVPHLAQVAVVGGHFDAMTHDDNRAVLRVLLQRLFAANSGA